MFKDMSAPDNVMHDRRSDQIWPLDTNNGMLSYTKMKHVRNMKQVRRAKKTAKSSIEPIAEGESEVSQLETVFEEYPVIRTNTGWFTQCGKCERKSDIEADLGLGVTIYFKQLKMLVVMFLICTVLSIPALTLFWSAGNI